MKFNPKNGATLLGLLGLGALCWLYPIPPARSAAAPAERALPRDGEVTIQPLATTTPVEAGSVAASATPARATPVLVPPLDEMDQARTWARQDPARAALWLASAPPGERREAVLEIVCAEVAQFDPASALVLAERFAPANMHLAENLVHQWAERDHAAAAAYAEAKSPGEPRNRLLARVALLQARTQPAKAAQWVVAKIPAGEIQGDAIISVLHQWAGQDPAAAQAWARAFPPGDLRGRALRETGSPLPR